MRSVWVAALIVVAGAAEARAQEPLLIWRAPESCPAREAWLASLRARVDDAAWHEAAPKLRATVRIDETDTGFALQLDTELDGATGQRRIAAASCAELVEASALIVAFAIDPRAAERAASAAPVVASGAASTAPAPVAAPDVAPETSAAAEPPPPPAPERAPPPAPAPVREKEAEPERSEADRAMGPKRFFVRLLALIDAGTLPDVALGPSAHAGLNIGRLSIELGGSYLLTQSVAEPDGERVVGELRWLAASTGACYAVLQRAFELAPCARLELGRIWGQGRNLEVDTFSGGATWLAVTGGLLLGYELVDGLALSLELAAGLPVMKSAFTVGGVGDVHESPAVVGRLSAGATVRF